MAACVLVVDDDQDIREALQEILEEEGYAVSLAADGLAALTLWNGGLRPDIILLDLMMPIMSGWELLERRAKTPGLDRVPVIVLSAVRAERLESIAAEAVLGKPVDLGALLAEIARLLERGSRAHEV